MQPFIIGPPGRREGSGMLWRSNSQHIASRLTLILLDFSLTVKAAILIFISGCCSAISSAK